MSSRDLNLSITADDLTRPATDAAGRNFDKLQNRVNKFSTKGPSAEIEALSGVIAKNTKDGETSFQAVQRSIDETKSHVASLRQEFAGTGSQSVFGDLKGAERELKALEGIFADMGGKAGGGGKRAGKSFGDEFVASLPLGLGAVGGAVTKLLGRAVADAGALGEQAGTEFGLDLTSAAGAGAEDLPQLFTPQGAIGAAVVVAIVGGLAAVIGAAVETALTVGVGAGFIGIAALVEKNNPAIVKEFGFLKSDIGAELKDAANPLVGSFTSAMTDIDATLKGQKPELSQIFTSLKPAVAELTGFIDDAITQLTPDLVGVGETFSAALGDPQVRADVHALVGEIGSLFTTIAANKQSTADFIDILVTGTGRAVAVVHDLEAAYNALDQVIGPVIAGIRVPLTGHLGDTAGAVTAVGAAAIAAGQAAIKAKTDYSGLSSQLSATSVTASTLAGQMTDKLIGAMLSGDEANLHFAESLTNVRQALKSNKDALDIHKASGQADREAILASVQANVQQYDAMIAAGSSAKSAAAKYDTNTAALRRQLSQAGLTGKQIDKLIGKYGKVPDDVNTNVAIKGLTKAINDLAALERKIFGIPDKTVHVHISGPSKSQINKVRAELARAGAAYSAGAGWTPFAASGDSAQHTIAPAREIAVSADVSSTLVLDGAVIDRRYAHVRAKERHRARFGMKGRR